MSAALPALFVAYARVSTARQGRSGLGLEAQQEAIASFIRQRGGHLLAPVFVEVESGRRVDRPQLAAALARCRATGATLLIAKLDRLARNARFLLEVVEGSGEGGVAFCDLPTVPPGPVGKFLVTQMAAVAELEAGLIAQRTRAALAAAKARGKALGGVRERQRAPIATEAAQGARRSAALRQQAAARHALQLAPRIAAALARGDSLGAIARQLQAEGVPTPRGGATWTATTVTRIVKYIDRKIPIDS